MRIAVGSDHAGYALKQKVAALLRHLGHDVEDLGAPSSEASVDYPDFAIPVAQRVASGAADRGVIVCATGIGVSIAANKVAGARAALVTSEETARLSRQHNDANVLALGEKTAPDAETALQWLRIWLATPFEGGRHARRVGKITEFEQHHPER